MTHRYVRAVHCESTIACHAGLLRLVWLLSVVVSIIVAVIVGIIVRIDLLVVARLTLIAERAIVVSTRLGTACVWEESSVLSCSLALLPPSEAKESCNS